MVRRLFASVALAGALLMPASVFAAPSNAPSAFPVLLMCDNGQTYPATVNTGHSGQNGQGQALPLTPGFIQGGGKLIPLSLTLTGTDLTTHQVLFSHTATKGQATGPQGTTVSCTFTQTSTAPNGDQFQIAGVATAVLTTH